jgi:hypothetical protein
MAPDKIVLVGSGWFNDFLMIMAIPHEEDLNDEPGGMTRLWTCRVPSRARE